MDQNFVDTQWESKEHKVKFTNQFIKFVENGYQYNDFPKWFYQRLSNCFGHIAHYNKDGFYSTWFNNKTQQEQFIEHCLKYPCYGDPSYTYSDVEKYLQSWIRQHTYFQLELGI